MLVNTIFGPENREKYPFYDIFYGCRVVMNDYCYSSKPFGKDYFLWKKEIFTFETWNSILHANAESNLTNIWLKTEKNLYFMTFLQF